MNKLKAYSYTSYDYDPMEGSNGIIYHHTAKKAKALGVKVFGYEGDYTDIACRRCEDADKYANGEDPYVEKNDKILRELGWCYEGEYSCDSCGLYPMGLEEYSVCPECCQCTECGCECEEDNE